MYRKIYEYIKYYLYYVTHILQILSYHISIAEEALNLRSLVFY